MGSRRLALVALALILVTLDPLVSACASFFIPEACRSICEDATAEPCRECLMKEDEKRAEARRTREEARREAPPAPTPPMGGGGVPGAY
jgi:hypothetical protein